MLRPGETVPARRTIDAGGRFVIPGLLDTHLHLGNAAQSFASDCATESRHAVTGGVTTLMPFVITRRLVRRRAGRDAARGGGGSLVDMLFHAIIVREPQIDEIPRMAAEFGVRSFKTFMAYKGREISPSGIQGMGDDQIFSVFQRVRDVPGGVAIVHCENMELIELHQKPFMAAGPPGHRGLVRRPARVRRARGHPAHVPVRGGGGHPAPDPPHGRRARLRVPAPEGVGPGRVATESCPHYLAFDKDTDRGVQGKVNPPLRGRDHIEALWQRLTDGTVDVMGSDHCPYTKAVKGDELWAARAGITAGSAMILPVLLTEGVNRGRLTMPDVVRADVVQRARLFGLYPRKGALEAGSDADLVIVDTDREVKVDLADAELRRRLQPLRGIRGAGLGGHDHRRRPGRLRGGRGRRRHTRDAICGAR